MTEKEFVKKLKIALAEAGLNQTELAEKMGIKKQSVSNWFAGYRNPKLQTLKKIAEATGKPLNYFFEHANFVTGNENTLATSGSILVKDSPYSSAHIPEPENPALSLLGVIKRGEVTFFNKKLIPTQNNRLNTPGAFLLEVRDTSLEPDFHEDETLEIVLISKEEAASDFSTRYLLIDIAGEQFIWKCTASGFRMCFIVGDTKKEVDRNKVEILGRVVAATLRREI